MLRGGLRPWSQTMVSEGARPWGRGRSGDYDLWAAHGKRCHCEDKGKPVWAEKHLLRELPSGKVCLCLPWRKTFCHLPVLPFLVFLEKGRENHQKTRIFYPYRTPKIPGKEGKNAQKNKEFLARRKNKEFKKTRKGRTGLSLRPCGPGTDHTNWKKGKDPHPQDKSQRLDFTKDARPLYYKTPPYVFYHKRSVVRPFSVLSKDEIGP